jgi:hypothetical protein
MEPRVLCMLGVFSTTELHLCPAPKSTFSLSGNWGLRWLLGRSDCEAGC